MLIECHTDSHQGKKMASPEGGRKLLSAAVILDKKKKVREALRRSNEVSPLMSRCGEADTAVCERYP